MRERAQSVEARMPEPPDEAEPEETVRGAARRYKADVVVSRSQCSTPGCGCWSPGAGCVCFLYGHTTHTR